MSNIEKMFEGATRNKIRFPFKGIKSVEDLWDLTVQDLDTIFKTLNSQVKAAKEESLLNIKSQEEEIIELKIGLVKYIVSVKLEEESNRLKEKERKEKKQKISAILYNKQEMELQNKSEEELRAMLAELE